MKLALFLAVAWVGAASAQPAATQDPTTPPPGATIAHRALRGVLFKRSHDPEDADRAAMQKMIDGMNAPYSGDPDHDLAVHMIPHHQGAIDTCKVELEYGIDPKIKQLCNHIVSAQQAEIKMMQAWLETHPAKSVNNIPQNIQWK